MTAWTVLKYALLWLVLAALFFAVTASVNLRSYWKLAHSSAFVQGTTVQVLPEMHGTVRYRYYVDGQEYRGQTQPGSPNPPISRLSEGAPLTVWYDPEKPQISVIELPSALFENEIISVTSVAVLSPTLILLICRFRMRRREERHST